MIQIRSILLLIKKLLSDPDLESSSDEIDLDNWKADLNEEFQKSNQNSYKFINRRR
jgi:hypothetical protein